MKIQNPTNIDIIKIIKLANFLDKDTKRKYLDNLLENAKVKSGLIHHIGNLDDKSKFISSAFIWSNTPEGHLFWSEKDEYWQFLNNIYLK